MTKYLVLICVVLSGCDIFQTREPENPNTIRSSWIPATSKEILITNLKNSFSEKSSINYINCLVDSTLSNRRFVFVPTSEALNFYSNIFNNWTLNSEKYYFDNLKSKLKENSTLSLSLDNENWGAVQSDSVSYSADYSIYVDHGIQNIPNEYKGSLQFSLIRNSRAEWMIATWQDLKYKEYPSWSELKGRFSN